MKLARERKRGMARLLRLLLFSSSIFHSLQWAHALWPQPRSLQTGSSALRLAPRTSFTITIAIPNAPADLHAAVERTRAYLFTDKLGRLVPSRGAEDLPAIAGAKSLPGLTLRLSEGGAREIAVEARGRIGSREEGYRLDVPGDGSGAVLCASSTLGLFRGLNTFAQLWWSYDYHNAAALDGDDGIIDGVVVYTLSAPVAIQDSPAYVSRKAMFFILYSWGGCGC